MIQHLHASVDERKGKKLKYLDVCVSAWLRIFDYEDLMHKKIPQQQFYSGCV